MAAGQRRPTKRVASGEKACGDARKKRHADPGHETQLAWRP